MKSPTRRSSSLMLVRVAAPAALLLGVVPATLAQEQPALAQATPPPAPSPPATVTSSTEAAKPPPAPPPPPYSLPWQLRPVAAANVIRSDTTASFHENAAGETASTVASTLLVSYKVLPKLAPLLRLAYVHDVPGENLPTAASPGNAFANPLIGALYQLDLVPGLRSGLFLGVAIPIGQGGNPLEDPAKARTVGAGIWARSAMDNALFAVNYLTVVPGFGLAYINKGFTAQIEATLLQLLRVRNKDLTNPTTMKKVDPDTKRTNLTAGLHLGYFLIPQLSVGTEIRMQRWLSTPAAVTADPTKRETITLCGGLRGHFKLGTRWLRPGLAYARGLDAPMKKTKNNILQIDVPFVF